jgi:glucokinase
MEKFAIGIDLGGTTVKFASVSESGKILADHRLPTNGDKGRAAVVETMMNGVKHLLAQNPDAVNTESFVGIGVGVPGVVQYDGTIKTLTNIPDWKDVNLSEILQTKLREFYKLSRPVFTENDANVAALGESKFGAGRALSDFIMITLGTGVGGGIIINQKIYRGSTGGAGELGHITINYHSDIVHAGIRGSIEGLIGHRQITAYTKSRYAQTPSQRLLSLCNGNLDTLEPKLLTEAAAQGDALALDVWNYVGEALGAGLGTLVSVMDIRKFIIGGGVAGAGDFILKPTLAYLKKFSLAAMHDGLEVLPAKLGNHAGVIGAAALCL